MYTTFKAECPKCKEIINVNNGKCSKCNYDIDQFMRENDMVDDQDNLVTNMVVICPRCGKIDASRNTTYLVCDECGHPFKITDIPKSNPRKLIDNTDEKQLIEEYVGDTINWDIYNARQEEWNNINKKRDEYQQQKQAEEQVRQDAIDHPKCPKCGSTEIDSANRGYSFFTGFLGSGKTMNYCKNCGYKWKPRK